MASGAACSGGRTCGGSDGETGPSSDDSLSQSPHSSDEASLSSSLGGELILSPLEPLDIVNNAQNNWLNVSSASELFLKGLHRRLSLFGNSDEYREPTASHIFSVAMGLSRNNMAGARCLGLRSISSPGPHPKFTPSSPSPPPSPHTVLRWKEAARKALHMQDPWAELHMEALPAEKVIRHRYNALTGEWIKDEIVVKMAKNPFGRGAMRQCFRMKRQRSNNTLSSTNYVAKRYIDEEMDRDTYFEDVKLQMDAKTWGEEYNRHNPPKKVDICQMAVMEFIERAHRPLYHLEHFIEGHYVKYNSNSGFINTDRLTPQAFSHFTFERSGHELVVVDIQGVGDLYTDPQIHTATGTEYGDGNLGVRGMALFFHSHHCNPICESLGLTPFDMCPTERVQSPPPSINAMAKATRIRGNEEPVPPYDRFAHLRAYNRLRTYSSPADLHRPSELAQRLHEERRSSFRCGSPQQGSCHGGSPTNNNCVSPSPYAAPVLMRTLSCESNGSNDLYDPLEFDYDESATDHSDMHHFPAFIPHRVRMDSECSSVLGDENERLEFQRQLSGRARASGVEQERARKALQRHLSSGGGSPSWSRNSSFSASGHSRSILAQIHLEMVKYYQAGRFNAGAQDDPTHYNRTAALFHLTQAAKCGHLEGVLTLARIHLGLPHDLLADVNIPNAEQGLEYLILAAEGGDRASMIQVGKAFDTGELLPEGRDRDWREATYWYDRAVETTDEDEGGEYDGCIHDPAYQLLARQAEMYMTGDFGLEKDPGRAAELYQSAAESATAAMKGRLANKYFSMAEEAMALVES